MGYDSLVRQADRCAKDYCRTHPETDKETVYYAAQEAAEMYDGDKSLQAHKFEGFAYLRIKTELRLQQQKEENVTLEVKKAIIWDYESGMTAKEIAERYQLNPHTTLNNLTNWAKRGLVELRNTTPTPESKPVHIPNETLVGDVAPEKLQMLKEIYEAQKEEPAPVAAETGSEGTDKSVHEDIGTTIPIIPSVPQKVKCEGVGTAIERLELLREFLEERIGPLCDELTITKIQADNECGYASIVADINGQTFCLSLERTD